MCDRYDDRRLVNRNPVRNAAPLKPVLARTMFSSGLNAYCGTSVDPMCNDPRNYRVSHGTFFIPIERPHELPIPSYPLFRAPNLIYTPQRSYLNMVANDPTNPYHYMAEENGIYSVG
jgi:hypothetical protein